MEPPHSPAGSASTARATTDSTTIDLDHWVSSAVDEELDFSEDFLHKLIEARAKVQAETPEQEDPQQKVDKKSFNEWKIAATGGEIQMRGTAPGNAFYDRKRNDAAFAERYKACIGGPAKRKFKQDFFEDGWKLMQHSKRFKQSFRDVDEEKVEAMTFGGLVIDYGGWSWPPAVRGAKSTAARCALLGGRWMYKDEWSGLWMFSKVTKIHHEYFENCWEECKEWALKDGSLQLALPAGGPAPKPLENAGSRQPLPLENAAPAEPPRAESATPARAALEAAAKSAEEAAKKAAEAKSAEEVGKKATEEAANKAAEEAAKKAADEAAEKLKQDGADTKKALNVQLKKMQALKKRLQDAQQKGNQFVVQVTSKDPKYDWANSQKHLSKVEAELRAMEGKLLPADRELMTFDVPKLKRSYTTEKILEMVAGFLSKQSAVMKLESMVEKMLDLHERENRAA